MLATMMNGGIPPQEPEVSPLLDQPRYEQLAAFGNDVPVQIISNLHGPIFSGTAAQAREFAQKIGIPLGGGGGYFLQRIPSSK